MNSIINYLKIPLILIHLFPHAAISTEVLKDTRPISEAETSLVKSHNRAGFEYILGAGDKIYIEFFGLDIYSSIYSIGPTGHLYLPEIGSIRADGLTIKSLTKKLKSSYENILKVPSFNIQIASYRPINVQIVGEVRTPGRYTLSGVFDETNITKKSIESEEIKGMNDRKKLINEFNNSFRSINFPTLYDSIRASGGITEYSNLSEIKVMRKRPIDSGGGYLSTTINILPELTGENIFNSQNIILLDGDIIEISKSDSVISSQMLKAMKSNINPSLIIIFISGQSEVVGKQIVSNGSTLNQALASAGGKKIFSGKVEFFRFLHNGEVDRRVINQMNSSKAGSYANPILRNGDIINVNRSPIGYAAEAISTISRPALGILSLYNAYGILVDND